MAAAGVAGKPVQLVRASRDGRRLRLELCEEGAQALLHHAGRSVAVVGVCGLYRTGKSYLLNLLSGRVQAGASLAGVGGTTNACTEGLWLWGCPAEQSDGGDGPLTVYLDCEGFGNPDRDRAHDATLLTLCALLSSVLLLNTKGALDTHQFNALALASRFAQHVEESGCRAGWPSLLWVLRDFVLELVDGRGDPITADEYLERNLRDGPREHRDLREDLTRFFRTRGCATLVRPAVEEDQLQSLGSLRYDELRPEFQRGFEELRARLSAMCRSSPKTASGQPLNCASFVALARRLVSSLNEGGVISLQGTWSTVQHDACGALADELREKGCADLRLLRSGGQLKDGTALPMSDEALSSLLSQLRAELREQWERRALGEESVQREYWQELEASLEHEEEVVRAQNARVGDRQLGEALKAWQEWVIDPSGTWETGEQLARGLRAQMERTPCAPLARAAGVALEAAGRRLVSARSALEAAQAERSAAAAQEGEAAAAQLRRLTSEREALEADNARLRSELAARPSSPTQDELQAERDKNARREETMGRLMESQRKNGRLEGQVQVMQKEVDLLRERVEELQKRLTAGEGEKATREAERDRLQQELREAAASAERWREQAAEWKLASASSAADEKRRPVEAPHGKQPPACCAVQ